MDRTNRRDQRRRFLPENDQKFRRHRNRRESPESSQVRKRIPKHPPHLRGREIGLYYARRNWTKTSEERAALTLRKQKEQLSKPVGKVILSETRQNFIEGSLKNIGLMDNIFVTDDGSYDHVTDSAFKRNFLNTIRGNIEDHLHEVQKTTKNPDIDLELYDEMLNKINSSRAYQKMLEVRKQLPCFEKKDEILKLINENQVIVLSGETGCGKTTQVAQFILDDYIMNKNGSLCHIVCTQPRRISAVSIAERVAEERAERLGKSVGYHIRLESAFPRTRGSIIFCTTGVVLKIMENDPCLSRVSHLILDEIHERDVMSDFIIALLKKVITKRKDLKLILMSATLNADKFSSYYDNCPHINIPGFTFPVKEFYLEDVLERTGFVFNYAKDRNQKRRSRSQKGNNENDQFWNDFVEPYIRNMEIKKQYSRRVCNQLRSPECEELNIDLVLSLLIDICKTEHNQGAILVFLTGLSEISNLIKMMEKSNKFPSGRYVIIPLHSQIATIHQKKIFDKPPQGVRKIIIATNIAETSITINDVVFVIDCGKIKMSNYHIETDTQTLLPEWVSLANANQRRGRAGRTQPGICFHLFTKVRKMALEGYQKPEVLRQRLEGTILTLKILKLGKAQPFLESLLDSPDPRAVETSLRLLVRLNALDKEETLTPLGYHLARLPMAPQMGKMILMSAIFSCVDPILSIAATLDFKDGFSIQLGKEKLLDRKKLELTNGVKNDHLIFIEAMKGFENAVDRRRYCTEYFLSCNTMNLLRNMKNQFMNYLFEMNFVSSNNPKSPECNVNSKNSSLIQAIICSGLYPNVAIMRKRNRFSYSLKCIEDYNSCLKFHPNSSLSSMNDDYNGINFIIYNKKLKSSRTYLHDASVVNPLSLLFFGDTFKQKEDPENCTMGVGNNINFKTNPRTAAIVRELRDRLNWFLENKVSHPGPVTWENNGGETKLLRAIMELITSEDKGELSDSEDDCLFVDETTDFTKQDEMIDLDKVKQEVVDEIVSSSSDDEYFSDSKT